MNPNAILPFFFGLLSLLCQVGFAESAMPDFSTCGIFDLEGELRASAAHPGHLEILTDKGLKSERRIVLGRMDGAGLKRVSGLRVAGRARIEHLCMGDCYGSWISTDRMLAPFEEPRSFAANLVDSMKSRLSCLEDSDARRRVVGK